MSRRRCLFPCHRCFVAAACVVALSGFTPLAAHAQTLTDIVLFRTDASGNSLQEGWNTRGADTISNLYLKSGASFVNSGDSASASLAIALSTPGTYTFSFVGENVNTNTATPLAINFFFNNNASTPGISARGLQPANSTTFSANASTQTNTPPFGFVNGANTLTFFNNGRQITLTDFSYQTTGGPDQVSSFNNAANGGSDTNGTFTLTVTATAAPEPGSSALLLTALLPAAGMTRRRRKRTS